MRRRRNQWQRRGEATCDRTRGRHDAARLHEHSVRGTPPARHFLASNGGVVGLDRYERSGSVALAFADSHAWLDATIHELRAALAVDDTEGAERTLALFARGLRHHLRVEETFLFEVLE